MPETYKPQRTDRSAQIRAKQISLQSNKLKKVSLPPGEYVLHLIKIYGRAKDKFQTNQGHTYSEMSCKMSCNSPEY